MYNIRTKKNYLIVEDDGITYKKIDFVFKLTLDNTVTKPTFSVYIKWSNEEYSYNVSGLLYNTFKMFLMNYVYEYMKSKDYQNKHKNSKSSTNSKNSDYEDDYRFHSHDKNTGYSYYYSDNTNHGYYYNPDTGEYYEDDYYDKYTNSDKKTPDNKKDEETLFNDYFKTKYGNSLNNYRDKTKNSKNSETPEVKNKRRRYNLLKQTLIGYERELFKILEWKKKNNNKPHDEEERVKNEISNLLSRMKEMNTTFKFENKKYNFTHLKRFNS